MSGTAAPGWYAIPPFGAGRGHVAIGKSSKGRKVDALAHRGDEGRDKLR